MKKKMVLKIAVIVIVALEVLVLAGGVIANNAADSNRSYRAIKSAQVFNQLPLNNLLYAKDEIAFIYDALHNQISGYPTNVPNFMNLPIDSIIDAIGADERFHIEYVKDDNYDNGVVIAQEPKAGALWGDGVVVNLTVNRKYSSMNSERGYIGLSLDKLYFLSSYYDTDHQFNGTLWAGGERLRDGEIRTIYVDNGNVYYKDHDGVYQLNAEGALRVLEKQIGSFTVIDDKIYYTDGDNDTKLYCYDMNDKTNNLVFDETVMFFYVNSDYIVCHRGLHDVSILDTESYTVIKEMHSEDFFLDCSLDNNNAYILEV